MVIEFEFKKILKDLRDMSKYNIGIQTLDKFKKKYPNYDINGTL